MHARAAAGGAALLLALFACRRLYTATVQPDEALFTAMGLNVPSAALWAAGLFVVLGAFVFLFTFGIETGIKGLDVRSHGLIDLLIDTESELNKVSWPSSNELTRSTTAVLISIIMLGGFLFCVGLLVSYVMVILHVLPR